MAVHGDTSEEITEAGFRRFLVDSPLVAGTGAATDTGGSISNPSPSSTLPCGSYHMMYRVDGELVAVGVVDFLPLCVVICLLIALLMFV